MVINFEPPSRLLSEFGADSPRVLAPRTEVLAEGMKDYHSLPRSLRSSHDSGLKKQAECPNQEHKAKSLKVAQSHYQCRRLFLWDLSTSTAWGKLCVRL